MGFPRNIVDQVLAESGRMCAVCNRMHKVQVHHMQPRELGGPDTYENAIPLCPNCHDEVHASYAPGRVSRLYTIDELRLHLTRTRALATQQADLRRGGETWLADVERMRFFGQCLDRPAFRHHFHQELSFADFDQAMEDTVLAINTGYWRTRDGEVIERGGGKGRLVNPAWRGAMDEVVRLIGSVRQALRNALALNDMILTGARFGRHRYDDYDEVFRSDGRLAREIDDLRNEAISVINLTLSDAGLHPLVAIGC